MIVRRPLAAYSSNRGMIESLYAIHAGHWKSANTSTCILPDPYVGVATLLSITVVGDDCLSEMSGLLGVYVVIPDHDDESDDPLVHDESRRSDESMRIDIFMSGCFLGVYRQG
jgi:hypothetical protein